jgi:hypothetical protein
VPGSPEPFPEDVEQCRGGLLVESQDAAVRDVWVEHDDRILFGHEQVGDDLSRRASDRSS